MSQTLQNVPKHCLNVTREQLQPSRCLLFRPWSFGADCRRHENTRKKCHSNTQSRMNNFSFYFLSIFTRLPSAESGQLYFCVLNQGLWLRFYTCAVRESGNYERARLGERQYCLRSFMQHLQIKNTVYCRNKSKCAGFMGGLLILQHLYRLLWAQRHSYLPQVTIAARCCRWPTGHVLPNSCCLVFVDLLVVMIRK